MYVAKLPYISLQFVSRYLKVSKYFYRSDMKKKNEAPQISNEFSDDCHKLLSSVSDALYAIGGKWKLMIIIAMARGNNRFTALQRMVKGISAKVLSSELKELEMNGFIVKKVAV